MYLYIPYNIYNIKKTNLHPMNEEITELKQILIFMISCNMYVQD